MGGIKQSSKKSKEGPGPGGQPGALLCFSFVFISLFTRALRLRC